jgi:hypothetical protein
MSGNKSNTPAPTAAPPSRDEIRAKIFGAKPECKEIVFFGTTIELRQPALGVIMEQRENDIREAGVMMLLSNAFVPGTNDRVFEPADEEAIRMLPMGPDLKRLFDTVNVLLGVGAEGLDKLIQDAEKSAEGGSAPTAGNDDSAGAREE